MAEVKSNIYFGDLKSSMKPMGKVFSFGSEQWVDMEDDDGEVCDSMSATSSSSFSDSNLSASCSASSSSSDLVEDASSSLTSCSSFESSTPPQVSKGPLYELSELMIHLPIKRGLSKHFQGKSQSFTSLSNVKCLEDLAKKESSPCRNKMMKACKSYGGGLDTQKHLSPRSCSNKTISKKGGGGGASNGSFSKQKKNIGFINGSRSRPPLCGQSKNDLVIS